MKPPARPAMQTSARLAVMLGAVGFVACSSSPPLLVAVPDDATGDAGAALTDGGGSDTDGSTDATLGDALGDATLPDATLGDAADEDASAGKESGSDASPTAADGGTDAVTDAWDGGSEGDVEAGTDDASCGDANLMTDRNNCGICGRHCCSPGSCVQGQCVGDGPPGFTLCFQDSGPDGCTFLWYAAQLTYDPCNCGGCGVTCEAGSACMSGSCVEADASPGCQ